MTLRPTARLLAAAAIALVAGCVSPTPSAVSVSTYKVSGTTLSALQRSVLRHGPRGDGQGRAFALVRQRLGSSFETVEGDGVCRYDRDGRIVLLAEVVLPEWVDSDRASARLRAQWYRLSDFAVAHEAGHIEITKRYAQIAERAYRAASKPTCAELAAETDRLWVAMEPAHEREQSEFDRVEAIRFRALLREVSYTSGN